jgi:uncharacterized protein (TIGR03435 family)
MAHFASRLAKITGYPVVDETGLTGNFDFSLRWTPDEAAAIPSSGPDQYPPLLAALEEQVGLKIEQRKVPAEVLVIDRATLPSGN